MNKVANLQCRKCAGEDLTPGRSKGYGWTAFKCDRCRFRFFWRTGLPLKASSATLHRNRHKSESVD